MPSLRYLCILLKQKARRGGAPQNVGRHWTITDALVMWAHAGGGAVNTGGTDGRGNDATSLFLCSQRLMASPPALSLHPELNSLQSARKKEPFKTNKVVIKRTYSM